MASKFTKEKLIEIINKGYQVALSKCFDGGSLYAQGFLDGIRFERTGIEPEDVFTSLLKKDDAKVSSKNEQANRDGKQDCPET